jgi:aminoglycoside phosphotransferase (APT) family kinase protein
MNAQPWHPEYTITPELARELIESQFPQLRPARVEFLAEGWDNTVYRVNLELVFRFPRREIAVPLIETERRLLPFIGPRLPLPIPIPRFAGSPAGGYPWPFLGYPHLPGRTIPGVGLSMEQRLALAAPLGCFLAALHAVPAGEAAEHGGGPDPIYRLQQAEARLPALRQELGELQHPDLAPLVPALQAIVDGWPAGYVPRTDTVVHADLHAEQILVDDSGCLTGIIDWGDAHLGDPALDVAGVVALLPPTALPAFAEAYGEIDPVTLQVARVRAVRHTLHGLRYAEDLSDEALLAEMVQSLQYVAGLA